MATKLKSSASFAVKTLVVLVLITILHKTCNCNKLWFAPKKDNLVKCTSLRCFIIDPIYLKLNECTLKAVNRSHKYIVGHIVMLKTFQKPISVHFRVLKRAIGGFKPFGIDVSFEGCKYLEGRRNLAFDWFYKATVPYSNLNHTCPYIGDLLFNISLHHMKLPSVFPDGEYRIELEIGTSGKVRAWAYADLKFTEI